MKHKFNPLGEKLKNIRLNSGISFKKAGKELDMSSRYIEAIENYEVDFLGGVKRFEQLLYNYSNYLGLPPKEIEQLYKITENGRRQHYLTHQKNNFFAVKWRKYFVFFVVLSALAFFLFYRINAIFTPPKLELISLSDGMISYNRELPIIGSTDSEAEVYINNDLVFVDSDGNFRTEIDLVSGLNIIKISAKKKYSRSQTRDFRVLFND